MTATLTSRLADYFRAHEGEWIDGRDLEGVGGAYAWRSRVSDCRRQFGMVIDNRQRRIATNTGHYSISEYRYRSTSKELAAAGPRKDDR